jgi:hypothetical protein
MLPSMRRPRDLDNKVLGPPGSPAAQAREAWSRRHGWSLFVLLGLVVLAFCGWALAADRPVIAGMNIGLGVAFVAVGVVLFLRRER